jgi:hypothetical protein
VDDDTVQAPASRKRRQFTPDEKWPDHFALITRGFWEEFCLRLTRNEWALYIGSATFYSNGQLRAFPTPAQLFAVCPLDKFARSRATRTLIDEELVEIWSEKIKGTRRWRTFYRFPHVDSRGYHMAGLQQPTAKELLAWDRENKLPLEYAWVKGAYLKSHRRVKWTCPVS